MKNFITLLLFAFVISCAESPKFNQVDIQKYIVQFDSLGQPPVPHDYVLIEGQVKDVTTDSLVIRKPYQNYQKTIKISSQGIFRDTLKIAPGLYEINYDSRYTPIFLRNGFSLQVEIDSNNFPEGVLYFGHGSSDNDFLVKQNELQQKLIDYSELSELKEEDLDLAFGYIKKTLLEFYALNSGVDKMIYDQELEKMEQNLLKYKKDIKHIHAVKNILPKGSVSPVFNDYENFDGSTTSLKDFRGSYVYFDIWATWCKPCLAEVPKLKKLQQELSESNIKFVSISVDRVKDYAKWRTIVKEQNLMGYQLIAPDEFSSNFIRQYSIGTIPRFILIDPDGKVVSPVALAPSHPSIKNYLKSLGI